MPLSSDDLKGYSRNWDNETRRLLTERLNSDYSSPLRHFSEKEGLTLRALLGRMIPQSEGLDLAGFIDQAIEKPLGRGDRPEGLPPEQQLFPLGLAGVEESAGILHGESFTVLAPREQDLLIAMVQRGKAPGETWNQVPSGKFLTRLLQKALVGYCAHPKVWMRMGFPGPSYPEGYTWITPREIQARRHHFPGWQTF